MLNLTFERSDGEANVEEDAALGSRSAHQGGLPVEQIVPHGPALPVGRRVRVVLELLLDALLCHRPL